MLCGKPFFDVHLMSKNLKIWFYPLFILGKYRFFIVGKYLHKKKSGKHKAAANLGVKYGLIILRQSPLPPLP